MNNRLVVWIDALKKTSPIQTATLFLLKNAVDDDDDDGDDGHSHP